MDILCLFFYLILLIRFVLSNSCSSDCIYNKQSTTIILNSNNVNQENHILFADLFSDFSSITNANSKNLIKISDGIGKANYQDITSNNLVHFSEADFCAAVYASHNGQKVLKGCIGSANGCVNSKQSSLSICLDNHKNFPSELIFLSDSLSDVNIYFSFTDNATNVILNFNVINVDIPKLTEKTQELCPSLTVDSVRHHIGEESDDRYILLSATNELSYQKVLAQKPYFVLSNYKTATAAKSYHENSLIIQSTEKDLVEFPVLLIYYKDQNTGNIYCAEELSLLSKLFELHVEVDFFMNYPVKKLLLGQPNLHPTLINTAGFIYGITIFENFDENYYRITDVQHVQINSNNKEVPRSMNLGFCNSQYIIEIKALTADGFFIAASNITFSPISFCLIHKKEENCFCEKTCDADSLTDSNKDGYSGQSDIDCLLKSAVKSEKTICKELDNHVEINSDFIDSESMSSQAMLITTIIDKKITEKCNAIKTINCKAINMFDGLFYNGVITNLSEFKDGVCLFNLPHGVFSVFHETNVGTKIFLNVIVCNINPPALEISNDGVHNYIYLNNGLHCPNVYYLGMKNDITIPQQEITWYKSSSEIETQSEMPEFKNKNWITLVQDKSHYVATVKWIGNKTTLVTTATQYFQNKESEDYIMECENFGVTLINTEQDQINIYKENQDYAESVVYVKNFLKIDKQKRYSISIKIMTLNNKHESKWFKIGEMQNGKFTSSKIFYRFLMDSESIYKSRIMVIEYDSGESLFGRSVCVSDSEILRPAPALQIYLGGGRIKVMHCNEQYVLLFTIVTNTKLDYNPKSLYDNILVDIINYKYYENTGYYEYEMALTGLNIEKESLEQKNDLFTLLISFGERGYIMFDEINNYYQNSFVEDVGNFEINSIIMINNISTETAACYDSEQHLKLNFDIKYSLPIDRKIFFTAYNKFNELIPFVDQTIDAQYIGVSDIITIQAQIDYGFSQILKNVCESQTYTVEVPQFVPQDIKVLPISVDDVSIEILLQRKYLFIFEIDGETDGLFYAVQEDDDLSNIILEFSSKAYVITANRQTDMIINIYNSRDLTGQLLCSKTIPASAFYVAALKSIPEIRLIQSNDALCSLSGKDFSTNFAVLETINDVYDFKLEDSSKKIYYPASVGNNDDKTYYNYENLQAGIYTASGFFNIILSKNKILKEEIRLSIILKNSVKISDIMDLSITSHGTKVTQCAISFYQNISNEWRQYYRIALQKEFYKQWKNDIKVTLVYEEKFGEYNTQQEIDLQNFMLDSDTFDANVMLKKPGKYFPKIELLRPNTNSKCLFFGPSYDIVDPVFTKSYFNFAVIKTPTCPENIDGKIALTYPSYLNVVIHIIKCTELLTGNTCLLKLNTKQSGDSLTQSDLTYYLISNIPYSDIVVRYEINHACAFSENYRFLPNSYETPILSRLEYVPSCDLQHKIIPYVKDWNSPSTNNEVPFLSSPDIKMMWNKKLNTDVDVFEHSSTHVNYWQINPRQDDWQKISLSLTYNDYKCKSSIVLYRQNVSLYIPPMLNVSKIIDSYGLVQKKIRSLPTFCPNKADGVIIANVDPLAVDEHNFKVEYYKKNQNVTVKLIQRNTLAVIGVGGDLYKISYTIPFPERQTICTISDDIFIPIKNEYVVYKHLKINPTTCASDYGSAVFDLQKRKGIVEELEFERLVTPMLLEQDKQYLLENDKIHPILQNIPDGHQINIRIDYPDKYRFFGTPDSCNEFLVIDIGKSSDIPIIYEEKEKHKGPCNVDNDPNNNLLQQIGNVKIPSWFGNFELSIDKTKNQLKISQPSCLLSFDLDTEKSAVSDFISGNEHIVVYDAKCSYEGSFFGSKLLQEISKVFNDGILNQITYTDLQLLNGSIVITDNCGVIQKRIDIIINKPDDVYINKESITNAICNKSPLIVQLNIILGSNKINENALIKQECSLIKSYSDSVDVSCKIDRLVAQDLVFSYFTSANQECGFAVNTEKWIKQVAEYYPRNLILLTKSNKNMCDSEYSVVLNDKDYLIKKLTDGTPSGVFDIEMNEIVHGNVCDMFYFFPVLDQLDSDDIKNSNNRINEIVPRQIIQPSTSNAIDGLIVWKIIFMFSVNKSQSLPFFILHSRIDETTTLKTLNLKFISDNEAEAVTRDLSEGAHWVEVFIQNMKCKSKESYKVFFVSFKENPVVLKAPTQGNYIVQPSYYPLPTLKTRNSILNNKFNVVTGLPKTISSNFEVSILYVGETHKKTIQLYWPDSYGYNPYKIENAKSLDYIDYVIKANFNIAPNQELYVSNDFLTNSTENMVKVLFGKSDTLQLKCEMKKQPSSFFAKNGMAEIKIEGGSSPYSLYMIDSDSLEKESIMSYGTAFVYKMENLGVGEYYVSVIDSSASKDTCLVKMYSSSLSEIKSYSIENSQGCNTNKKAIIKVHYYGNEPYSIGIWNKNDDSAAITSCVDNRMKKPSNNIRRLNSTISKNYQEEFEIYLEIPYEGVWFMVVCIQNKAVDDSLYLMNFQNAFEVTWQNFVGEITAEISDGILCANDNDKRFSKYPTLKTYSTVDFNNLQVFYGEKEIYFTENYFDKSQFQLLLNSNYHEAGKYYFQVYDDPKCIKTVSFVINEKIANECGSCVENDRSCFGCDGIANSGKKIDDCGICGGNNACKNDCKLESDNFELNCIEMQWCASRGNTINILNNMESPDYLQTCVLNTNFPITIKSFASVQNDYPVFGGVEVYAPFVTFSRLQILDSMELHSTDTVFSFVVFNKSVTFYSTSCKENPKVEISNCEGESMYLRLEVDESLHCDNSDNNQNMQRKLFSLPNNDDSNAESELNKRVKVGAKVERKKEHRKVNKLLPKIEITFKNSNISFIEVGGNQIFSIEAIETYSDEIVLFGTENSTITMDVKSNIKKMDVSRIKSDKILRQQLLCAIFKGIPNLAEIMDGSEKVERSVSRCYRFGYMLDSDNINNIDFNHVKSKSSVSLFQILGIAIPVVLLIGLFIYLYFRDEGRRKLAKNMD